MAVVSTEAVAVGSRGSNSATHRHAAAGVRRRVLRHDCQVVTQVCVVVDCHLGVHVNCTIKFIGRQAASPKGCEPAVNVRQQPHLAVRRGGKEVAAGGVGGVGGEPLDLAAVALLGGARGVAGAWRDRSCQQGAQNCSEQRAASPPAAAAP